MARFLLLLCLVLACRTNDDHAAPSVSRDQPADKPGLAIGVKAHGIELLDAPGGDVAELVRTGRAQAKAHGRTMLVYIGATWCEPCQRFHHAAEEGKLDDKFPTLSLIVFDLDADKDRLAAALYGPGYIPYFGIPDDAGKGTSNVVSGSVKGEGAVDNITPRLEELLAKDHP